ncbi:hypothetical protein BS47DRAFT_1335332 [Hydnum rufescens UP504]|uniref:Uncharacterized protein n=1 Tax=Hydnum rufescens UP504 TaxID=1448309 RepID=A0A9P6BC16_9AGAM|nr:hypothetical protein BS47DRAFT_1335332 [Hydnum rufescens UP504]
MDYVRGFGRDLDQHLRLNLDLTGTSAQRQSESYFAQPRAIVAQRESLTAKLARLDEADRELTRFERQNWTSS